MGKYLKFYNKPLDFDLKRARSKRRIALDRGKPSSEYLNSDIEFVLRKYNDFGTVSYQPTSSDTGDIVLRYPVEFKAKEFSGQIDFGFKLTISKDSQRKDKNMWRLGVDYAKSAIIENFNCAA